MRNRKHLLMCFMSVFTQDIGSSKIDYRELGYFSMTTMCMMQIQNGLFYHSKDPELLLDRSLSLVDLFIVLLDLGKYGIQVNWLLWF